MIAFHSGQQLPGTTSCSSPCSVVKQIFPTSLCIVLVCVSYFVLDATMADQENRVHPPVEALQRQEGENEAVRQAAQHGAQRPARQPFVPKPVVFLPLDIIKFVDELSGLERLVSTKTSPALDGLALGASVCLPPFALLSALLTSFCALSHLATTSLRNGSSIVGKVIGIDASVDNMRPLVRRDGTPALSRPRFPFKLHSDLTHLLCLMIVRV